MANNYTNEIESKLEAVNEVVEKYEGGTTADATIHVDNVNHIITATLNTSGTESFPTIEDLISAVNNKTNDQYKIGTELLVGASGVPDFWVYAVSDTYNSYNFTTLQDLVDEIRTNGHVQVGYYLLAINETDLSGYVSKSDFTTILSETLPEIGISKNKLYLIGGEKTDQVTVSVDEETQIVTINGTPSGYTNIGDLIQIKPYTCINGKTYNFSYHYISGEGSLASVKLYEKSAGLWSNVFNLAVTAGNQNKSFSSDKLYDTIGLGVNGTYNNLKFKLQLEEGEVAHDWEMPSLLGKVVFEDDMEKFVEEQINIVNENVSTVESIAKGAQQAMSYSDYATMISELNTKSLTELLVGQNILIVTLEVPDLWVSEVIVPKVVYTYVSDEQFVEELKTNGSVQVGFYKLSALETAKVNIENMVTTDTDQTITGTKTFSSPSISDSTINCPNLYWGGSIKIGNSINKPNANGILIGNNLSLGSNLSGSGNVLIGYDLKTQSGQTSYNVLIGYNMGGSEDYVCQGKDCVVIGHNAHTGAGDKMIQLGTGTNPNPNTFQVFDYQMLDANGKIPAERLPSGVGNSSGTTGNVYSWSTSEEWAEEWIPDSNTYCSVGNFNAEKFTTFDTLIQFGTVSETQRKWFRFLHPTTEGVDNVPCYVSWYYVEPETSSGGGSGGGKYMHHVKVTRSDETIVSAVNFSFISSVATSYTNLSTLLTDLYNTYGNKTIPANGLEILTADGSISKVIVGVLPSTSTGLLTIITNNYMDGMGGLISGNSLSFNLKSDVVIAL